MSARSDFLEGGDHDESEQRMRRSRRKPRGKQRLGELSQETVDSQGESLFSDPLLANLQARGHLDELLGELKSGKEATVYVGRGPRGPLVVKLYRDLGARSFHDDSAYTAGRFIADTRARRAVDNRSARGLQMAQDMWVMHEWQELWTLYQAGLPVPQPLIGPDSDAISEAGRCVVMRFLGELEEDQAVAAPRLSDIRLLGDQATDAWDQALTIMAQLLALGRVHGDYSTYNLLYQKGRVYVIDFPQMTTRDNPNFEALLRRDAESLTRSFARHGLIESAEVALREVRARARKLSAQAPLVMLP